MDGVWFDRTSGMGVPTCDLRRILSAAACLPPDIPSSSLRREAGTDTALWRTNFRSTSSLPHDCEGPFVRSSVARRIAAEDIQCVNEEFLAHMELDPPDAAHGDAERGRA